MNILVTGGTGFIGSHTIVSLYESGHTVVALDNLVNSSKEALNRVERIVKSEIPFYEIDLRDREALYALFEKEQIDAVIHFAGLKAVGESVNKPLSYYDNNIIGTITLLEVMDQHSVKKMIFSSSATVYGLADIPYVETETAGIGITSPYGRTKYMIEQMMQDLAASDGDWELIALRYFNPIGAHESGTIGEDPQGIPNNLMPYITQVAVGKRDKLNVFGGDYDTPDGTCIRDYIHVMDLAAGHVAALEHLSPGFDNINLGSGHGVSVLDIIKAFEQATSVKIPYEIVDRRDGDLPAFYANAEKASHLLKWSTKKTLEEACADTWRWQSQNVNGYNDK